MRAPLISFFGFSIANNLVLGFYLVILPWTALSVRESLVTVGRMFLLSSVLNMILAPVMGAYTDSLDRRLFLWISQLIKLLGHIAVGVLVTIQWF